MAKKKSKAKKSSGKGASQVEKNATSFEESLQVLKEILNELEEGNLPLAESLEKYEAGIGHLRNCHDSLKQARARIELLVRVDRNGKAVTEPFDHKATIETFSAEEAAALQDELDEETETEETEADGDWDGGLF